MGEGWGGTVVLLSLHSACCGSEEEASGWRGAEQEATLGRGNGRGHISRPTGILSPGLEQLSSLQFPPSWWE